MVRIFSTVLPNTFKLLFCIVWPISVLAAEEIKKTTFTLPGGITMSTNDAIVAGIFIVAVIIIGVVWVLRSGKANNITVVNSHNVDVGNAQNDFGGFPQNANETSHLPSLRSTVLKDEVRR